MPNLTFFSLKIPGAIPHFNVEEIPGEARQVLGFFFFPSRVST